MGKLHEILAVEGSKRAAYEKILNETAHVFQDRADLFTGEIRRYEPFDDEDKKEAGIVNRREMETTVQTRIDYLGTFFKEYIDVVFQKEKTNKTASGNIEFDNYIIAEGVPVSFLLHLESVLGKLRNTMTLIPTSPPGINWILDHTHLLEGVTKAEYPEEALKTKKIIKPFELSPATKEHKAQVEKLTDDKAIGKYFRDLWSGMYSPAQKGATLKRIDMMIESVRVARMKANSAEVFEDTIGEDIFSLIFHGRP